MKKKPVLILIIMSVMLIMTACTARISISKLNESTVVVTEEGEIVEISIEDFGESYYLFDDLSIFVNDTVNEFNDRHIVSGSAITIGTMEEVDEKARVEMSFTDAKAYEAFHDIIFINTDISGLSEETRGLTYITHDKREEIDVFSLEDSDKYKTLVTDDTLNLMIEGKIEYYSHNVQLIDKNHVKTADELSVIIYK